MVAVMQILAVLWSWLLAALLAYCGWRLWRHHEEPMGRVAVAAAVVDIGLGLIFLLLFLLAF